MRRAVLTLAALALIGGCNKSPEGSKAAPRADTPSQSQTNTPSAAPNTAASGGASAASPAEKQEGRNPQQGQVDPKASEQHRDFQQKGDGAGPKPGG